MKNYEKPVVLANSEMSEGVYAASGCYSVTAFKCQNPISYWVGDTEKWCWTVHVDGVHVADHHSTERTFIITFNQAVKVQWPGSAELVSGDNTATITIKFTHHNTDNDVIGLSDVQVLTDSPVGLEIVSVQIVDCNETCSCW